LGLMVSVFAHPDVPPDTSDEFELAEWVRVEDILLGEWTNIEEILDSPGMACDFFESNVYVRCDKFDYAKAIEAVKFFLSALVGTDVTLIAE